MSVDTHSQDLAPREPRALALRALPVILVVAFLWYVVEPLVRSLVWISGLGSQPGLQLTLLLDGVASLIASVPIVCLLYLVWKRRTALGRLYWLLPLFFAAMGMANLVGHATGARDGVLTFGSLGGLLRAVVYVLIGVGLWICRPHLAARAELTEV